ncbi:MAG: aminotransferase class I/II-fold pyridoxal phosphate-dependent enzyme, partial [Synergistaceae bacterium]|nr:aminotransferase class I/II-fold pyridoxal phosphate-dependent enzyme [Synergistaceae bacterium]
MSRASVEVSNSYFRRLIRPQVLSLEEYSPGPSPDYDGAIRISANENCFGAAPAVREAIIAQLNGASGVFRYPDGSCSALRERLSGKFGLPPEWFMAGNGLDDVISTIAATFLGPDDEVIIPAVSFVMYENAVRLAGAASVRTPMTQGLS